MGTPGHRTGRVPRAAVTVGITKPDLEHGLNGAWLLLVVATESIAVLASLLAQRTGPPTPLVFASLAFYLLGSMLYVLLAALIFFRWVLRFVAPFTVLLWATSTFWIPLLVILFIWKEMQRGPHGYDSGLWSAMFPLGMYTAATHDYATVANLPFLDSITQPLFWIALLAWALTFIGMWVRFKTACR